MLDPTVANEMGVPSAQKFRMVLVVEAVSVTYTRKKNKKIEINAHCARYEE
jgi:hypothetical protein